MSQIKQALDKAESERQRGLLESMYCPQCGELFPKPGTIVGYGTKWCTCRPAPPPSEQRTDRELLNALDAALGRVEQGFAKTHELIKAHDDWCHEYNATVRADNERVKADHARNMADHEEWKNKQTEAVLAVMEIFTRLERKLDALQTKKSAARRKKGKR